MPIDRSCPRCGAHDAELDVHGVYGRVSTGWGLAKEEWTWYCSVWCREAAAGVPPFGELMPSIEFNVPLRPWISSADSEFSDVDPAPLLWIV